MVAVHARPIRSGRGFETVVLMILAGRPRKEMEPLDTGRRAVVEGSGWRTMRVPARFRSGRDRMGARLNGLRLVGNRRTGRVFPGGGPTDLADPPRGPGDPGDPGRRIGIAVRSGGELSGEDVVPGFRCPVDTLFPAARRRKRTPGRPCRVKAILPEAITREVAARSGSGRIASPTRGRRQVA
jgi:hypothetical protein